MKIVVLSPMTEEARQLLEADFEVEYAGWAVTEPVITPFPEDDEIIRLAGDARGIIVPGELSARVIEACGKLEVIGISRGDPRGVDLELAGRRAITVVYAAGRNAGAVAELTLAFAIMLFRQLLAAHQFVGEKRWQTWDDLFATPLIEGLELEGRVMGLVGFGYVGREVARRAAPFGLEVLVYDPYVASDAVRSSGGIKVELAELLERSDLVSLHCKVTEETRGLIGKDEIESMKPGAFFINTARAAVVDKAALTEALAAGKLAGAALDVYWDEPLPADDPILDLSNVIHTPHIGSATVDVDPRTAMMVARDVRAVLKGIPPEYPARV